ncbi:serine/threonine-protein kinase [Agromyces sp. PvR057]|uniref:serine/threonine-protein kinase n=1 Tax=Agromyces sp. PvR057 TaxID=3156403 RepID=UPI003396614E
MSPRPPSTPPELPGFTFLELIGSGGFADVFLYEQQLLRRRVAVKVLLADKLGEATMASFNAEANLMAQIATHPAIVSVYEASISRDGRPYLVMEYCSKPNLQARHRRERFSEAETLRIGVQIAGAVETAHRAGIFHRDIKPANILVTDYGRPALTDFGIASTVDAEEQAGMSVPWSPPEAFAAVPRGDARSDVYSLAATLYTLLSGRSPFQLPGASNGQIDLMSRIQTMSVPALGRADVSPALEAALRKAMSKSPGDRHASALDFGRSLQRVQAELGMQPTVLDVVDDEEHALLDDDEDDGLTRISSVVTIEAQAPRAAPPASAPSTPAAAAAPSGAAPSGTRAGEATDATIRRGPTAPPDAPDELDATIHRGGHAAPGFSAPAAPPVADTAQRPVDVLQPATASAPPSRRRSRVGALIAIAAAVLLGGGAVLAFTLSGGTAGTSAEPSSEAPDAPVDAVELEAVPGVAELVGTAAGAEVAFTWTNPDPQPGDTFLWRAVVPGEDTAYASTEETAASTPTQAGTTCIEVLLRRESGRTADEPVEGCVP